MLSGRTRIHECLRDYTQASINSCSLIYIENEIGIFDEIDPEPQRKTMQNREET